MQRSLRIPALVVLALTLHCSRQTESAAPAGADATAPKGGGIRISSPAFGDHQSIPPKYTCDGHDLIPPLTFTGGPAGAKSIALVMDDPDAPGGTWDHWVMWNIPPVTTSVEEGKAPVGVTGRNGWGKNAYGGPCPPDREHRYFFRAYVLDTMLDLAFGAGKKELTAAMEGRVLDQGELVGVYERQKR